MSDDDDFDEIPTLSNIVFPGNPEKIISRRNETNPGMSVRDEIAANNNSDNLEAISPSPKNTYIEDELNSIVEAVLARHLAQARRDIVDEIMVELHKRLP